MKKIVLTDTVFPEGSRRLQCVERVHLRVSPASFCKETIAKNREKRLEKRTKISTYFNLRDGITPRDFCGMKNRGFIPHKSQNPEIFIPQKSRKNTIQFSPIPGKLSFISLSITPSQFSLEQSHSQNQGKN